MNKIVRFLILLTILSLSCNFMTGLFTEPGLVEATGPILTMTVAASLDDQGQPVDAAFTYPADQPEMVVLIRMGEVTPGPMTFSWIRVTESGDEPLFEQTVEVEARDAAFSTGLNPGVLAAGTYKVVATFAGESETIAWDVAELQPVDSTAPLGKSASTAGGVPTPGPSGTRPVDEIITIPGDVSAGALVTVSILEVNRADRVRFSVSSEWKDGQGTLIVSPLSFIVQVRISINGSAPDESRDFTHNAGIDKIRKDYLQDPCRLPDGSDLPGTSIIVTAVIGGSQYGMRSAIGVLGADTSAPMVELKSQPSNGATVKKGDKIVLSAIAEEKRTGASWQTGVSKIEIYVMEPSGEELLTKKYDEYEGLSCEAKSWKQTTEEKTYIVPEDVKGDIRICAFGYDFAGNPTGKKCYTFHTGKLVKGKLKSEYTASSSSVFNSQTSVSHTDAELSLTLEPDGTLNGTAEITYAFHEDATDNTDCGTSTDSIGPVGFTLPVTGTWTEDALDFHFTAEAPIMVPYPATNCDGTFTEQTDVTAQVTGYEYQAAWDGQAYTADETISNSSAGSSFESHWTIRLEHPAPAVGFNPAPWAAANVDRALVDLTYP